MSRTTENYEELIALADRAENMKGASKWIFSSMANLFAEEAKMLDAEAASTPIKRASYSTRADDCRRRSEKMTNLANLAHE